VLDGDGSAYGVDGLVLDCPATTIPELVEWTLRESGLGAPKLNRYGKDSDPLIVLTATAAVKLGLPERLEGHGQHRLCLPEDHPVDKQPVKARWRAGSGRGRGSTARCRGASRSAYSSRSCRGTPSMSGPGPAWLIWTRPTSPAL
jgi:hypothetical protein